MSSVHLGSVHLRPGPEAGKRRKRARKGTLRDAHVVRYVPGTSPMHRLWAGTKLLAICALSVGLFLWPSWKSVGVVGVVVSISFLAARLPRGISPRVPWWIAIALGAGVVVSLVSGGAPEVHVGALHVGLGGLSNFARLTILGIEVLAGAAVISWTMPLADLSPALGRLLSPLRRLAFPVDEVVGAIALAIRCLPLLLEEARVSRAAHLIRRPTAKRSLNELSDEAVEDAFGALASAIRRAREIAEAIESRGGMPTVALETHRVARLDVYALAICALALVAMGLLR